MNIECFVCIISDLMMTLWNGGKKHSHPFHPWISPWFFKSWIRLICLQLCMVDSLIYTLTVDYSQYFLTKQTVQTNLKLKWKVLLKHNCLMCWYTCTHKHHTQTSYTNITHILCTYSYVWCARCRNLSRQPHWLHLYHMYICTRDKCYGLLR